MAAIIKAIMKIGIIISIVLVLIVGGIIALALNTPSDAPSSNTTRGQLALQKIPADLPELFSPPPTGQGDAKSLYENAIDTYKNNARRLESRNPPATVIARLKQDILAAADTPIQGRSFLDSQVSDLPGENPAFGAAMEMIPTLILQDALESKNDRQTQAVARAVFIMGQRAFELSDSLYIRREGLMMMQKANGVFLSLDTIKADPQTTRNHEAWRNAISAIENIWDTKRNIIQSVRQHKGDLLNIAANDEDPTFRIAATGWLGVAKFNPGNRGNEKAIQRLIESSKTSDDPAIAAAANAADAFTREQLRKLH